MHNTHLTCQIPAKTFLIGEYAILDQQPAILLATPPRFNASIDTKIIPSRPFTHPQSPAGQYLSAQKSPATITLSKPTPLGGLGQSSAEFLCAWLSDLASASQPFSLDETALLALYHQYCPTEGIRPSGADVMCQYLGEMTYHHQQTYVSANWPFSDINISLWHTGHKIATHKHLASISTIPIALGKTAQRCVEAIQNIDSSTMLACINTYRELLKQHDLEAPSTTYLVQQLQQNSSILACKGCGALGADVIIVLNRQEHTQEVENHCTKTGLTLLFSGQKLATGLKHQLPSSLTPHVFDHQEPNHP